MFFLHPEPGLQLVKDDLQHLSTDFVIERQYLLLLHLRTTTDLYFTGVKTSSKKSLVKLLGREELFSYKPRLRLTSM